MGRENIRVFVCDRNLGIDKSELRSLEGQLDSLVRALETAGYDLTVSNSARGLTPDFDLAILHPPWRSIGSLYRFHEQHPDIPLIFYSGMAGVGREKRVYSGINIDEEGCYIAQSVEPKRFLSFLKHLTGTVLRHQYSAE